MKYRSPDRYLSASQDVSSPHQKPDDTKFEEDILPPFRSVFSQSTSPKMKDKPKIKEVGDLEGLFPRVKSLELRSKADIVKVNRFEAHEIFRKLCKVEFSEGPKVNVGLSFWYHADSDRWPLIAECAFDYEIDKSDDEDEEKDEEFSLPVILGSMGLFTFLQKQPGWFNFNTTTKTSYVYDGL